MLTMRTGSGSWPFNSVGLLLQVLQPFDASKFNFTKALQKEVLFQFAARAGGAASDYEPLAPVGASPNLVFINVSPIEYGHVLLVPRALSSLPQVRTSVMLLAKGRCCG